MVYPRQSSIKEDIKTDIYQSTLLHKEFAQPLNVVILEKTNIKTNACSHVVLFSNDLGLSYEKIIDYYKLRFRIEFNFCDAKQLSGLEDFMNRSQITVTNAANLSFFRVNLSFLEKKGWEPFKLTNVCGHPLPTGKNTPKQYK